MKKLALVMLIILLFAGCDKDDPENFETCCEEKPDSIAYTTHNLRLYLKNNRIIEKDYLRDDTVRYITKYYFTEKTAKVVFYELDTTIQEHYIVYTIGDNGFAKWSIEYPESISIFEKDTIYGSRLYYTYNSLNQLINVECKHTAPFFDSLLSLYAYTYNGENMSSYFTQNSECRFQETYESSDITSKIDILNFTNGILGETNTKLTSHIKHEHFGDCPPYSYVIKEYDLTYTLDDLGYVIQSRKSFADTSYSRYPSDDIKIRVTIFNYDIQLLD